MMQKHRVISEPTQISGRFLYSGQVQVTFLTVPLYWKTVVGYYSSLVEAKIALNRKLKPKDKFKVVWQSEPNHEVGHR